VAGLLAGAFPVIGSYGARDLFLKDAADRLDRALAATGVDRDVKEYPERGTRPSTITTPWCSRR